MTICSMACRCHAKGAKPHLFCNLLSVCLKNKGMHSEWVWDTSFAAKVKLFCNGQSLFVCGHYNCPQSADVSYFNKVFCNLDGV